MSTSRSPTSSRRLRSATWTTPSGSSPPVPRASFRAGTPKRITPGMPRSASARTSFRRLSWVCWTTPGIDGIGCGWSIPSLTNRGATRSSTDSRVSATNRRTAAVRRNRRGRCSGKPIAPDATAGAPLSNDQAPTSTVEQGLTAEVLEDDPGRGGTDRLGVGALLADPEDGLAVERGQEDVDGDRPVGADPGQRTAGEVAAAPQTAQEGPLGFHLAPGRRVVDCRQAGLGAEV